MLAQAPRAPQRKAVYSREILRFLRHCKEGRRGHGGGCEAVTAYAKATARQGLMKWTPLVGQEEREIKI